MESNKGFFRGSFGVERGHVFQTNFFQVLKSHRPKEADG